MCSNSLSTRVQFQGTYRHKTAYIVVRVVKKLNNKTTVGVFLNKCWWRMQALWINPYVDPPAAPEVVEQVEETVIEMDVHRNVVPLKVVNAARYQNGPLPFLAPVASLRYRKISTAPARYTKSNR